MNEKQKVQSRIRGWLPKGPLLKEHTATAPEKPTLTEEETTKKLIKAIAVTNPIISLVIVESNFSHTSLTLATVMWTFAELTLILLPINILLYLFLRNRTRGRGV
jgi:hypothetical protein